MQQPDIEAQFIILIRYMMLQKQWLTRAGADYSLTPLQTMTLFLLTEPQPMHNLKTTFSCDASNITGIADGLVQKGFVERTESPTDRRIKLLALTAQGTMVRDKLVVALNADTPLYTGLDATESADLARLLTKLGDL